MGARVGLVLAAFFAGSAVQTAYLPLWLADRGLRANEIGLVLGVAALVRIGGLPLLGWVADRLGRRLMLAAAGFGAGMCALLLAGLQGVGPLLAGSVAMIVAAALLTPLADAVSLALAAAGRLDYGRTRAWGSGAYMLATAAGGSLLAAAGTGSVPLLLAALYGLAGLLGVLVPDPAPAPPARAEQPARMPLRFPAFRWALLASAAIQGSHAAYYSFAPLLWRGMGIGDGTIGLILAVPLLAEMALFWWGRAAVERLGPGPLTLIAALAAILRWGLTSVLRDPLALGLVQMLHAATFGLQHLSAMLVVRELPGRRAAMAQTLLSALGLGLPTGVLVWVSGMLVAPLGALVFLVMSAAAVAALPAVPGLRRHARPPGPG